MDSIPTSALEELESAPRSAQRGGTREERRGAMTGLRLEVARLGGDPNGFTWRVLLPLVAGVERLKRARELPLDGLYPTYLAADGGPRTDTFMARERTHPSPGGARAALCRARVLAAALARFDGAFPGQPLRAYLARERGWIVRRVAPEAVQHVALVSRDGAWLAPLDPTREGEAPVPIDRRAREALPCALAAAIEDVPLDAARHVHRLAWTRGGGPWIGIGTAGHLDILSTCHLALDGYAHARIADAVLGAPADEAQGSIPRESVAGAGESADVAWTRLEPAPRFPAAAWALGRALARLHGGTPTLQVPFVVGPRDAELRLRRVLHAVLAGPAEDEALAAFEARLHAQLERERGGHGFLTRVLRATIGAPLPRPLLRRLLAAPGRPTRRLPPVELLGGRGRLSYLRFRTGEAPRAPLMAASAPALAPTRRDPLGGCVLTLVVDGSGATATLAGPEAGRRLAAFEGELARLREVVTP